MSLAVVVVALVLVGSACGNDDGGGIVVPAEAPLGRCAEHVSQGVYDWELCAWGPYRESPEHNRALSDADADALIGLIWEEVEVEGKPAAPPTSALVPRNTGCPTGSSIVGCYDQAAHHIARSDPFAETLLHEVAHALIRDHPSIEQCRQAAGGLQIDQGEPEDHRTALANSQYTRCSHSDLFRCVADHLFTEYAGIPSAGVCGIAPASPGEPGRSADPECTPLLIVEGLVFLCQVENTSWFRLNDPVGESDLWSYLEPKRHTLESLNDDDAPTLDIVCQNDSFSAYIDFFGRRVSGQQALGGRIPVYYEFDGSPIEEAWEESDFSEYALSPDPAAFAESLAASSELVFTAWNSDGSLVGTIVFDTTGADREVKRVLTACGIS